MRKIIYIILGFVALGIILGAFFYFFPGAILKKMAESQLAGETVAYAEIEAMNIPITDTFVQSGDVVSGGGLSLKVPVMDALVKKVNQYTHVEYDEIKWLSWEEDYKYSGG